MQSVEMVLSYNNFPTEVVKMILRHLPAVTACKIGRLLSKKYHFWIMDEIQTYCMRICTLNPKVQFEVIGVNFTFWKSEKRPSCLCWSLDNTITAKRWNTDELWFTIAYFWGKHHRFSLPRDEDFTKSKKLDYLVCGCHKLDTRWSDPNGENFVSRPLDADYTLDEISYKI